METALLESVPFTSADVVALLLGALALVGAVFTITRRNPVTAVMGLVWTFVALAGIYAILSAHFLAIMQVLVYAGAIMVLFIFVVMILNREEIAPVSLRGIITRALGVLAATYVVLLVVGRVVVHQMKGASSGILGPPGEAPAGFGTVKGVGLSLFQDFVFPFEAISVLLLVAIVGGLIVSRSHAQEERAEAMVDRLKAIRGMGPRDQTGDDQPDGHGHGHGGDDHDKKRAHG